MLTYIDKFLNQITIYRLVLYFTLALLGTAMILGLFGVMPYSPLMVLYSIAILTTVSYIVNKFFAHILKIHENAESVYITAWILALIVSPPNSFGDMRYLGFMALVATLAQASKYLLVFSRKHIFNPAAFGIAAAAFLLPYAATWWVGSRPMLPLVLLGGLLLVRKLRRTYMVLSFFVSLAIFTLAFSLSSSGSTISSLQNILWSALTMFFAFVMFTEPLTTPPTQKLQIFYGILVGALYTPFVHVGSFYFTPELALLVGNVFSYAVSPKHRLLLTLKEKIAVANDTYHFIFSSNRSGEFTSGQYMEWTLGMDKPDTRGNRRYFTVASAPEEEGLHIGVKFYKQPSSFKKKLAELEIGDTITASHPAGDFTLPKNLSEKMVFIAGGIGITPFRSMVSHMLKQKQKRDIVLLYSNRTPEDIAYSDILEKASSELGLKTVYTVTDNIPPAWTGRTGFINRSIIEQEVPDYTDRTFYISGPQNMVTAFSEMLSEMGVHSSKIKKDFFPGFA